MDTLKDLGATCWAAGSVLGIDTSNGDFTYGSGIGDAGANSRGLTKLGANTVTLTGTNSYTGPTTVAAGTLKLQDTGAGLTQTLGDLTLAGADVTLQSDNAGTGVLSTTLGTLTARTAGETANIVCTGGVVGSTNLVNLTQAAGFIDKGVFFDGADYAAMDTENGYVRALAYGTDPDTEAVDTITAAMHVKLTTTPADRADDTLRSLNLAGDGVNYTMSSGTLTVGGILKSGGSLSTISGGTAVTAGTDPEFVIRTDTASDLLAISTPITGAAALTKSGAGTLTLSGVNGYTGATTVNGGTLEIGDAGTLASGTAVSIAPGATFNYNSTAAQTLSGTIRGDGNLVMSGGGNLTISGTNTDFDGTISISAGTLTLNSESALGNASVLNIDNATVAVGSANNALGTVPIGVTGTATITSGVESNSLVMKLDGQISGDGGVIFQHTGGNNTIPLMTLGAQNTYSGDTSFKTTRAQRFAIQLGVNNALPTTTVLTIDCAGGGSGRLIVFDLNGFDQGLAGLTDQRSYTYNAVVNTSATACTLTVNNNADYTFRGFLGSDNHTKANLLDAYLGSNFGLTKKGIGKLTLTANNSYEGDTVIEGGMLSISNPYLADAADVYLTTNAMFDLNFIGIDVIDELFFDGTAQADGTWGAIDSGADHESDFFAGTGWLSVTTPGGLAGDINEDGVVDAADYIILKQNYGTAGSATPAMGDLNGDTNIDATDLGLLATAINAAAGKAVTPEPATLALLAFGGLAVIRRKRREEQVVGRLVVGKKKNKQKGTVGTSVRGREKKSQPPCGDRWSKDIGSATALPPTTYDLFRTTFLHNQTRADL